MQEDRNGFGQPVKQPRRDARVLQPIRLAVERDRGHPASDVTADGLRINEVRRRGDRADAHAFREMNIGHERDVHDIVGPR
ncbi:MAG: hypothetical protein AMXMBFR47_25250 [Planctomycetota bacterium]